MLRITTTDTARERKWILEGQLAGPFVAELRSAFESSGSSLQLRKSVVDLSNVTFIDEAGAQVLCGMAQQGVRFISRGVDTKNLLEGIERKAAPPLRRCLSWLGQTGLSTFGENKDK